MSITSKFYETYDSIQAAHYAFARISRTYRYLSLSLFAILAPVIVLTLHAPAFVEGVVTEIVSFYRYLPKGFKGEERNHE